VIGRIGTIVLLTIGVMGAQAMAAPATIPPGTRINAQNWQQYKDFFPEGIQVVLSGNHPVWKLPADWEIDVGPTIEYPLPKSFLQATEKYSGQARLKKLDNGAYTIENYTAGTPFPEISGPDAAYKLLYDQYYHYSGAMDYYASTGYEIDRYGNKTTNESYQVYLQFTHVTDPGFTGYAREMPGYFVSYYDELLIPEQSKYTSPLELIYDDPQRVPEFYVFLPSLRRALRLSSSARCAPYAGSDYVGDDIYGTPLPLGYFQAKIVGEKNMLLFRPEPENRAQYDVEHNYYLPMMFPKPAIGKWMVFPAYVLDVQRVPSLNSGYCYGLRRMFLDKRNLGFAFTWTDLYDSSLKFWKLFAGWESPEKVPHGDGYFLGVKGLNWMVDFQNEHASFAMVGKDVFTVNENVPQQFRDVSRYGSPAGLNKIMK